MNKITFSINQQYSEEYTLMLDVSVEKNSFKGTGGCWISVNELEQLAAGFQENGFFLLGNEIIFPNIQISEGKDPTLVFSQDTQGYILIKATIIELYEETTLSLTQKTTYEHIKKFGAEINAMIADRSLVATLKCE